MARVAVAVLSLLTLAALATPTEAQVDNIAEPMGSIYLSWSATEHVKDFCGIPLATPFAFYLVMELDFADIGDASQNAANGARAWEATVTLPAAITILANVVAPASSVNFGLNVPPVFNYIVGTGVTRVLADSTPFAVVTYNALVLSAIEFPGEMGILGPSAPSSVPGSPTWVEELTINGCTIDGGPTNCIRPFETTDMIWFRTCLETESESWGTLKSTFGR